MGAEILTRAYVEAQGRKLGLALRRSAEATNWLQHKEPRGPRPVALLLLDLLSSAQAQVPTLWNPQICANCFVNISSCGTTYVCSVVYCSRYCSQTSRRQVACMCLFAEFAG